MKGTTGKPGSRGRPDGSSVRVKPLLTILGLGRMLDGREVLGDVDLQVAAGEVLAVAGPSGSGKTVLLRCLNRLSDPDSGSVHLGDVDAGDLKPTALRRRIGMIFQFPVMFPGSVRDNVAWGWEHVGGDGMVPPVDLDRRVLDALSSAGLDGSFAHRKASELSGGERQRVCIARALCIEPEVLLMDEPTASLDPRATGVVERTVRDLAASGLAIIMVTHDMHQARRMGDRIAYLESGRLLKVAETDDFFQWYDRRMGRKTGGGER